MPRILEEVAIHRLNVDPEAKEVKQKKISYGLERRGVTEQEVQKLLSARFIEESKYPTWLSNVVMVKKANGKWRICVDFTNLNRAFPKDCFLLP